MTDAGPFFFFLPSEKKKQFSGILKIMGRPVREPLLFFFTVAFTHANNHRGRERDIRSATTRLAVVVALETGDDPIVHMTNIVTRAGSMKKKKKTAILYKTTSKLEKKKKTVETQKQSHSRGHREKRDAMTRFGHSPWFSSIVFRHLFGL